ncbi:hypothetical protein [uncultured Desulfosarcina sp.]|uniref:hypothetical protein n=1 Tax=uncultured Desulfosarcina sp. TaxID=218289 RepID=UPI0029C67964|nr:hypothetical protein [uncultured Desulfosarcina sp.]
MRLTIGSRPFCQEKILENRPLTGLPCLLQTGAGSRFAPYVRRLAGGVWNDRGTWYRPFCIGTGIRQ